MAPRFLCSYVFQEPLQRGHPSRPADQPAVQPHRHHPAAFSIKGVKTIAQVIEELRAGTKTLCRGEAHVVRIQRVRHDELRPAVAGVVPGQLIAVIVGVVDETAVLDHQAPRVRAGPAGVPAERPYARQPAVDLDRALHVLALELERDVLVVDPAPAMARDLVTGLEERFDRGRVALHGHRHAEHSERQLVAREELEQPPYPNAGAVLVDRLHGHMAYALERLGAHDLGEERLRSVVAVEDGILAAFLVVEHELQREPRTSGPFRPGRLRPVADKVTRVVGSAQ